MPAKSARKKPAENQPIQTAPVAVPKTWQRQAKELLQDAAYFLGQSTDPAAQTTAILINQFLAQE